MFSGAFVIVTCPTKCVYFSRKIMRPLVRSYGVISTTTLSPCNTRMRFLRILPAVCARISWSFSNFTRNIALGRTSLITPLNSIRSSFDILIPSQFYSVLLYQRALSIGNRKKKQWQHVIENKTGNFSWQTDQSTLKRRTWINADVAKLVDAPDLGSGDFGHGGSSPFIRTIIPL